MNTSARFKAHVRGALDRRNGVELAQNPYVPKEDFETENAAWIEGWCDEAEIDEALKNEKLYDQE